MESTKTMADYTAELHGVYTDAAKMVAWLDRVAPGIDRLERARSCSEIAKQPRGRFGVETSTPAVVAVCEAVAVVESARIAPAREAIKAMRDQGLAWDEINAVYPRALAIFSSGA